MPYLTVGQENGENIDIYCKDWGSGQSIVFSHGFNRPDAKPAEPIIRNWWRQGMMGGAKAHSDGIVAFSQTDNADLLAFIQS